MRLEWIDKAKGIGIILVILGHTICPPNIKFWLYSFHMPLFFFLSGYVFKIKTPIFLDFLIIKIRTLLIPAFILGGIGIIYSLIEGLIFDSQSSINFIQKIWGIFIQMRGFYEFSFGPWFVICLFTIQIMMFFLIKYIKSDKLMLVLGVLGSILGYVYCTRIGIVLPWAVDCALIGILFFIAGYLLNKHEDKFKKVWEIKYFPVYLCSHVALVGIQDITGINRVNMFANQYSNYLYFILTSFSGIFFIITLTKGVRMSKELSYIGQNSLIYYALHTLILSTSLYMVKNLFSDLFTQSYYFGVFNVFLCLFILHPIASLINEYQVLSWNFPFKQSLRFKNY